MNKRLSWHSGWLPMAGFALLMAMVSSAVAQCARAGPEEVVQQLRTRIDGSSGEVRSALLAKLGSLLRKQEKFEEAEEAYVAAERGTKLPTSIAAQVRFERAENADSAGWPTAKDRFREATQMYRRIGDATLAATTEARWIDLVGQSADWQTLNTWAKSAETPWTQRRVDILRRSSRLLIEGGARDGSQAVAGWLVGGEPAP